MALTPRLLCTSFLLVLLQEPTVALYLFPAKLGVQILVLYYINNKCFNHTDSFLS